MHPYLTRLGVRQEVQQFFAPFYDADDKGNLVFNYGGETETYGFAFHRVPMADSLWIAGTENLRLVQQVFICQSAMEAISYLHLRFASFADLDGLLFIALGSGLTERQLQWISSSLPEKKYNLLFPNDFLGRVAGLKIAAGLRRVPVSVYGQDGICTVSFRQQNYDFETEAFSISAFEKRSRYRFGIPSLQPKGFNSFFEQLKAHAF